MSTIELGLLVIGSPGSTHRTPQAVTPDGGSRALGRLSSSPHFPPTFRFKLLDLFASGVGLSALGFRFRTVSAYSPFPQVFRCVLGDTGVGLGPRLARLEGK